MAALPVALPTDPTLDALRSAFVAKRAAEEGPRTYLGMSSIGQPCSRRLWYSFRLCFIEQFDAPTLWRFDDGFRCEDVQADRLRLVPGVHLLTVDPRTGQQFAFIDLGGHFRGHADGMITGILQAPRTLHVWEAKAVNDDKFAKLDKLKAAKGEKLALAEWDAVYHAQAILYMAYSETTRHYLTCSTPGARAMTSVRTDADLDHAAQLRNKAEKIITAAEPCEGISTNPTWYECKWCPAQSICHGNTMPLVNCRTCAHATPEMDGDGRWSCGRKARDLSKDEQLAGCAEHRYIPALVKFAKPVDASAEENWVQYEMPDGRVFRNGEPGPCTYTSEELRVMDRAMIADDAGDALRTSFDGRHVAAA